jgi:purine-binding chemotaxis protein CheW
MTQEASAAASDPGVSGRGRGLESAAGAQTQFISFAIGDDQYGVDIMAVREIKGWSEITALPSQPDYVRGVLNLRGAIVPIVDLRCRFGQGKTEATALHVMIIVQIASRLVGLLADRVLDIVTLENGQMQPVPKAAAGQSANFIAGLATLDSGMLALIDLTHLLSEQIADDGFAAAAADSRARMSA